MRDFARAALTLVSAGQGLMMLVMELNRTHATNPKWTGHARFHLVWQDLTSALFSIFTTALIWWRGAFPEQRFFLAAVMTAIPLIGFTGALVSRGLYGGALSDANGVPPMRLSVGGRRWEMDGNVVAAGFGWLGIMLAMALFR